MGFFLCCLDKKFLTVILLSCWEAKGLCWRVVSLGKLQVKDWNRSCFCSKSWLPCICCQHRANLEKLLKFAQGNFFAFLWALQHRVLRCSKGRSGERAEMQSDQSFHLPLGGIHTCFFGQLCPGLSGNRTSNFGCAGAAEQQMGFRRFPTWRGSGPIAMAGFFLQKVFKYPGTCFQNLSMPQRAM